MRVAQTGRGGDWVSTDALPSFLPVVHIARFLLLELGNGRIADMTEVLATSCRLLVINASLLVPFFRVVCS